MCGIVGIVGQGPAAPLLYDALTMLQHRGQDAAGIATLKGHQIRLHKGNGLVRDVFEEHHMANLTGKAGIVHLHVGDGARGLSLVREAIATSELATMVGCVLVGYGV